MKNKINASTASFTHAGCTCVEVPITLLGAKTVQNFSSFELWLVKNARNENQQIFIDNLTFVYVFICHRQQQRVIELFFLISSNQQFQRCLSRMFYSQLERSFFIFIVWVDVFHFQVSKPKQRRKNLEIGFDRYHLNWPSSCQGFKWQFYWKSWREFTIFEALPMTESRPNGKTVLWSWKSCCR